MTAPTPPPVCSHPETQTVWRIGTPINAKCLICGARLPLDGTTPTSKDVTGL